MSKLFEKLAFEFANDLVSFMYTILIWGLNWGLGGAKLVGEKKWGLPYFSSGDCCSLHWHINSCILKWRKYCCFCEKDLNWCAICFPHASSASSFDSNDFHSSKISIAFLNITYLFNLIVSLTTPFFQTIDLLIDIIAGVPSSKSI